MRRLVERYETGNGVAVDAELAKAWNAKAAQAGDEVAKFKTSALYATLRKSPAKQDALTGALGILDAPHESIRQVNIHGADAVRAFVMSDPFFATSMTGKREADYRFDGVLFEGDNSTTNFNRHCSSNGRIAHQVEVVTTAKFDVKVENDVDSALGGLMYLRSSSDSGWSAPTRRSKIDSLESIEGQPFPLRPGKRFGLNYRYGDGGEQQFTLACMATGAPQNVPFFRAVFGPLTPLVCLESQAVGGANYYGATVFYWDESSGCFVKDNR